MGFGFNEAKTLEEVGRILRHGYNKEQSYDTRQMIVKGSTKKERRDKISQAKNFAKDKVSEDHPLEGITMIFGLDPQKLVYFITQRDRFHKPSWHKAPQLPFDACLLKGKFEAHRQLTAFSKETSGKDFSNYHPQSPVQAEMMSMVLKLVATVCYKMESEPRALILTGGPGIGKTHLCRAAAGTASAAGIRVLYLDAEVVRSHYSLEATKNGGILPEKYWNGICDKWISDIDFFILDDINNKYSIANSMLQKIVQNCLEKGATMLVSSNEPVNLTKCLFASGSYLGYDHPSVGNFLVMSNLKGVSHRQSWRETAVAREAEDISNCTPEQKIEFLAGHVGDQSAAVIIEADNISMATMESWKAVYQAIAPTVRIKCLGPPIISVEGKQRMSDDYWMLASDSYDLFIMQVTDRWGVTHLLHLLPMIHDHGKKLVVICTNQQLCCKLILENLASPSLKDAVRLTDRAKTLFLEPFIRSPMAEEERRAVHVAKSDISLLTYGLIINLMRFFLLRLVYMRFCFFEPFVRSLMAKQKRSEDVPVSESAIVLYEGGSCSEDATPRNRACSTTNKARMRRLEDGIFVADSQNDPEKTRESCLKLKRGFLIGKRF